MKHTNRKFDPQAPLVKPDKEHYRHAAEILKHGEGIRNLDVQERIPVIRILERHDNDTIIKRARGDV